MKYKNLPLVFGSLNLILIFFIMRCKYFGHYVAFITRHNSISFEKQKLTIKFIHSEKAKYLTKSASQLDDTYILSNVKTKILSNFVSYSENLNF